MWLRLKAAQIGGEMPVTHAGVLGQVWRGGPRQARLARALDGIDIRPLDKELGRAAGLLLAGCGLSDVVDAAVVAMTADGDEIVTSDGADFTRLAVAADRQVELLRP